MDPSDVKEIFKKNEKTIDELQLLKAYLNKLKFFQQIFDQYKYTPEMIFEICSQIKYEQYPSFRLIFQQNDTKIDKAYVILSGIVMITMKDNIDIFEKESETSQSVQSQNLQISAASPQKIRIKNLKHVNLMNKVINARIKGTIPYQDQEEAELDYKRLKISEKDYQDFIEREYGQILLEQTSGSLFGEKALVENKPRAATVITKTDCEFLVVERKDFDIILNKFKKIQLAKNDFILQIFPFLGNLITSARVFERVVRFFIDENTFRNQILVKENTQVSKQNSKIFIIVQGEFKVFKVAKIRVERVNCLPHINLSPIHISTLGRGEFFGEECVYPSEDIYQYSVQCISSFGQIMTLDKQIILKKLPEQIKELLICTFKQKKMQRQIIFKENCEKVAQQLNSNDADVKEKYLKELSSKPVQIIKRDKSGRTLATINTDTSKLDQIINTESELIKLDYVNLQSGNKLKKILDKQNFQKTARSLSPIRTQPISIDNTNWLDQSDIVIDPTQKASTKQQQVQSTQKTNKLNSVEEEQEQDQQQQQQNNQLQQQQGEEDLKAKQQLTQQKKEKQFTQDERNPLQKELMQLRKIANNDLSQSYKLVKSPMFNISKNMDPYPFALRNKDLIQQKFDLQLLKKNNKDQGLLNDGQQNNSAKLNNLYQKILSVRTNQKDINEVSFAFEKQLNSSLDKMKTNVNSSTTSLKFKSIDNQFPQQNRSLNYDMHSNKQQLLPLDLSKKKSQKLLEQQKKLQNNDDSDNNNRYIENENK